MYSLIRNLLFLLPPELAHHVALSTLNRIPAFYLTKPPAFPVLAMGLTFPNPVGLAAGLDKNADYLDALAKLGFGFIEVGTVTPRPQSGNPKPRLFRLPKALALINRMGFNNAGIDQLIINLEKSTYSGILGINIGKNKDTPLNEAANDYLYCLRRVYSHASYVTINISSPNTPDLRQLQQAHYFSDLVRVLRQEQLILADKYQRLVPLVVKLSPDESDDVLKHMAEIAISNQLAGIIATNTTCSREQVTQLQYGNETGGLSGKPLQARSTHCLKVLKSIVGDELTLIGVGGIDSPTSAKQKFSAGASLIQLYTGLIYQGPDLIHDILNDLMKSV